LRIDLDRFSIPMSRPDVDKKEREFMLKVFDSNWLTQGKITRDFEEKLDNYLNSNCVVVNNGSLLSKPILFSYSKVFLTLFVI